MSKPSFDLETSIAGRVCGLDEVGRGPLAGPVVAAAVYIPEALYTLPLVSEIRDSKKLSEKKLEQLYSFITKHFSYAVCEVDAEEIDKINILQASLLAMQRSAEQMDVAIDHALVDGNRCPKNLSCPSTPVIKGDSVSISIGAASIVAKVTRDRLMKRLDEAYPYYGWSRNVGYPTREHLAAIDQYGLTPYHRKSFAPVRRFLESGSTAR